MADELDIDALWDYDEPAWSEARFQEQLAGAAGDPAQHAEVMTQIARAQGLQGHFDTAHGTLDAVAAQLPQGQARVRIRYLLERGRVFNSSGNSEAAQPYFQQAWDAARAAGEDFYAVDAAHMLAIVATGPEKLGWNLNGLHLAENSTQPRAWQWLGSLYNNIGWSHFGQGEYDVALTYFERALAWRRRQAQPVEIRIAQWCVGRTLRALGRVDEALALQFALAASTAAEGKADGYVDEEIAECLLLAGRAADAMPYFARAHALLANDPWLAATEPERLARLEQLGRSQAGG